MIITSKINSTKTIADDETLFIIKSSFFILLTVFYGNLKKVFVCSPIFYLKELLILLFFAIILLY